jgi:DNA-binding LacI/PurR family transcriptional regulator
MKIPPDSQQSKIKLSDIAKASGVSLAAVSLALGDKPGISQETRSRVIEIARTMGYRFKSSITNPPVKSIKTIGLLVKSAVADEPHANHFYSHIIAGIEFACRQNGIHLMFANLAVDAENFPLEIPLLLEKGDIDAIVLAGAQIDPTLSRAIDLRALPVVLVDSYCETRTYNSILSDNIHGAFQATEFLIKNGHRNICFVGPNEKAYPSFHERRQGYSQAISHYGLAQSFFVDCPANRSVVGPPVLRLLQENPLVSAVFAVNDDTAIAIMHALIEAGYRVPQDISIVGFDDIYLAESVIPTLTTMRINKQSMGRLAVQLLINHVSVPNGGLVTSLFQPILVVRNSVAVK